MNFSLDYFKKGFALELEKEFSIFFYWRHRKRGTFLLHDSIWSMVPVFVMLPSDLRAGLWGMDCRLAIRLSNSLDFTWVFPLGEGSYEGGGRLGLFWIGSNALPSYEKILLLSWKALGASSYTNKLVPAVAASSREFLRLFRSFYCVFFLRITFLSL